MFLNVNLPASNHQSDHLLNPLINHHFHEKIHFFSLKNPHHPTQPTLYIEDNISHMCLNVNLPSSNPRHHQSYHLFKPLCFILFFVKIIIL